MKSLLPTAALLMCAAALAFHPTPSAAQSDILLQLRSGSPQGDRLRVDSAGGFVAMGTLGIGIIPATGCGYRMMWYPYRGAFRAGTTDDGGSCDYWNDSNIGFYSWAGGNLTRASAYVAFAFGDQTVASGTHSATFGSSNTVSGTAGFSVGASNQCTGFTCVALGYTNRAAGQGSVAIGYRVHASADYATALGHRAHSKHTGAFAWGDASTTDSVRTTANNQFIIRAAGGVRLHTNATLTTGVFLNAGGSSWSVVSDRNHKELFRTVDGEDLLMRLRGVPVTSWNYIAEGREVRHIGPMAQDWHAAFALNDDPLTINQGDFDGVNLAAVQALERRTAEQAERIRTLEVEQARQAAELAELRAAVRALTEARAP